MVLVEVVLDAVEDALERLLGAVLAQLRVVNDHVQVNIAVLAPVELSQRADQDYVIDADFRELVDIRDEVAGNLDQMLADDFLQVTCLEVEHRGAERIFLIEALEVHLVRGNLVSLRCIVVFLVVLHGLYREYFFENIVKTICHFSYYELFGIYHNRVKKYKKPEDSASEISCS